MTTRVKLSAFLLLTGGLLALLPLRATRSLSGDPQAVLSTVLDEKSCLTADQVARMIVTEDSLVQLVDLRPSKEYNQFSLPGSVNVPYEELPSRDPATYLGSGNYKNILYSNGDLKSAYAAVLAAGYGYENVYIMKGGLNSWNSDIMTSRFEGKVISARENALFEIRLKARRLFTEINSLPDSLKGKYLNSRKFNPKKLDGGCE